MKAVIAFLSGLIFVALVILAVTTLGGAPRETIEGRGQLRGVPELSTPVFIVLSAVIGLGILGLLAASIGYLAAHRGILKGFLAVDKNKLRGIQVVGLVLLMAVITIVIAAFMLSILYHPDEDDVEDQNLLLSEEEVVEEEEELYEEDAPSGEGFPPTDTERRNRIFKILLVPLGIALFLLILFFSVRLYRSRLPAESEERDLESLKKELAKAVQLSLRDILRNRDHRAAVIACYARMELVLSRNGFPRYIHQTPLEYMESVLRAAEEKQSTDEKSGQKIQALPRAALLQLTHLYEIAKFSTHEMSSGDRDEAIRCLTELGEKLSTRIFQDKEAVG